MAQQDRIRTLKPGQQVREAVYLLAEKQVRVAKNGRLFLSARLRDMSGEIEARLWDLPPGISEALEVGQGVRVSGEVTSFQGRPQLRLDAIAPHPVAARDFFPASERPLEEMKAELEGLVRTVTDPWLLGLLQRALLAPDFLPRFVEAPAAREYHHACLGGLIEHTLGVAALAESIVRLYPDLSRDLLLTVALLHDIGKVEAYEWEASLRQSDEGRLLDHIYLGARRVEKAMDQEPAFPPELRRRILHAILSHHGTQEAGSPVRPQTLEAVALHLLDMLDAQVRGFRDHLERHTPPGAVWSDWSKMFNAQLYRGSAETTSRPPALPDRPALLWDEEGENEGDLPL